jgi:hypothetical protein
MNDLSHFVPLTETVTVRGNRRSSWSASTSRIWGSCCIAFPEIANMIMTGKFDPKALSREAMSAFVAVGAGKAGDEDAENRLPRSRSASACRCSTLCSA